MRKWEVSDASGFTRILWAFRAFRLLTHRPIIIIHTSILYLWFIAAKFAKYCFIVVAFSHFASYNIISWGILINTVPHRLINIHRAAWAREDMGWVTFPPGQYRWFETTLSLAQIKATNDDSWFPGLRRDQHGRATFWKNALKCAKHKR